MAADVLTFLMENQDDYVSGEYIAKKLGISRMAVSKKIALLKEGGFDIVSKTNKGYRLVSVPDVIIPEYISQKTLFRTIYHYETVDSTNLYARTFALDGAPERTLVVSEMQDAGRGRLGRVWSSPKGGLWFSFVLRPRCPPSDAPILNFVASNAIAKALKSLYGITVSMKWPNDIFYHGNKLCGVAFLVSSDIDLIHYIVVGIGINVNNDPPEGMPAESIRRIVGHLVDRNELLATILTSFEEEYTLFEQRKFEDIISFSRSISNTIGKFVRVSVFGKERVGYVQDISDTGSLLLQVEGIVEEILAGDVDFLRPL